MTRLPTFRSAGYGVKSYNRTRSVGVTRRPPTSSDWHRLNSRRSHIGAPVPSNGSGRLSTCQLGNRM